MAIFTVLSIRSIKWGKIAQMEDVSCDGLM